MEPRHYSPVIPADFKLSMPERDIDFPGRLGRPRAPISDPEPSHPHHPPMTSAALGLLVSTFAMVFTINLAQAAPNAVEVQRMSKDIYPLLGAAMACCGVFALYDRRKETPWHIIGRVIFGLMGGFVAPWFLSIIPVTFLHVEDYRGLWFVGACGAILGFILSRTTIERLFSRAGSISEKLVDAGEQRLDDELNRRKP